VYNGKSFTDSVFYVALLVHKEMPEPVLIPLFNEKKLDSLLRMRNANSQQGINLNYNSGYLFKLIWQPIEKHLSGITKIYFAADGLLHKVSMAALRVNKNQVLSDKYQLIQLFSTAFAGRQTETKLSVKDKVILYGAVQFDADSAALAQSATKYQKGSFATRSLDKYAIENNTNNRFPFLPKSEEEIDTISKYASEKGMRSVSLKRTDANEESIQELSGDTTSFVLHLATHGFFNTAPSKKIPYTGNNLFTKVFENTDDPLFRTGLLFAGAENTSKNTPIKGVEDGVLTAYEISNMHFPHNKLTVLSACETALGDIDGNEGVYGLQRAFKMAGTESLIMSLWKVPDEQTTEFMKVFYKAIFNDISITDAFYRAQETMKKKYANEPNKWAGLILIK
jgi:CHAT domain-containing protein